MRIPHVEATYIYMYHWVPFTLFIYHQQWGRSEFASTPLALLRC